MEERARAEREREQKGVLGWARRKLQQAKHGDEERSGGGVGASHRPVTRPSVTGVHLRWLRTSGGCLELGWSQNDEHL